MRSLAMWAGIECTVNRVGDRYFDQLVRSGHHDRDSDLEQIAELGVRKVRYPIIWERTAPGRLEDADWSWPDARLASLRRLNIEPIAGLLHHGSGPAYTSLVDPELPGHLARYAGAVAARYPWLTDFTPVNEPLTTARFSGLYGHWYPHGRSNEVFARALVGQCRATVLAMRAIREVTPQARLISTEDLGATHSAPGLAYQAAFENERRWLSLDLLCGRIDRCHALWRWLQRAGISADELAWFTDNPCPPDVIGCNYYVTSERYLDPHLAAWPAEEHGGNGRDRYADVAAARACGLAGPAHLLAACHARFRRPIAITEAHLGCTSDEQIRWLVYIYDEVTRAIAAGVPVVALTAWALLGSYDWHCLVTRDEGLYEPGVFDCTGARLVPTPLAPIVSSIARGRRPSHDALASTGWWRTMAREAAA
jgi:dTDP-4-dehydrorhamnose reductase